MLLSDGLDSIKISMLGEHSVAGFCGSSGTLAKLEESAKCSFRVSSYRGTQSFTCMEVVTTFPCWAQQA